MKSIAFDATIVRQCWIIIGIATLVQGALILLFRQVFVPPIFHRAGDVGPLGWATSAVAAAIFIAYSIRGLKLEPYIAKFPTFRILGPIMAVPTSILEEVFFRQVIMNTLAAHGLG